MNQTQPAPTPAEQPEQPKQRQYPAAGCYYASRITKTVSDTANDLRTLAGQLDHWNAGRRDQVYVPPEAIPDMLHSIAKEAHKALTLFYGPEHMKGFSRRLNGGRR